MASLIARSKKYTVSSHSYVRVRRSIKYVLLVSELGVKSMAGPIVREQEVWLASKLGVKSMASLIARRQMYGSLISGRKKLG
jgi:hypothetical protein